MTKDKNAIVALGDSITYGYPYTPQKSWVWLTAEKLGLSIINKGINGDTTTGMLARFNTDVVSNTPGRVIIMGGTNDAYLETKTNIVMDNLRAMIELAQQNGIEPILGLPIFCNDAVVEKFLQQYRAEMRQQAERNRLSVLDFSSAFGDGTGIKQTRYSDNDHPNSEGYRFMADVAIKFFINKIAV